MAVSLGQALSEKPALKPYWGKPAVRNFREGNGNVGIIRSPLRAMALPDQSCDRCGLETGFEEIATQAAFAYAEQQSIT